MYEENLHPLPEGDLTQVFADALREIQDRAGKGVPHRIGPADVLQWATADIQPTFGRVCRRLLLPGSGVAGVDSLAQLTSLAESGKTCIVCLNHRSTFDVPTLYVLLEDHGHPQLFHKLIWVAGRKLDEDVGATGTLAHAFNRVVVTPLSWLHEHHSPDDLHEAHEINIAAHRAIHDLKRRGWVFALFPTATRIRPHDESTTHAIEETDSYLKHFDYMLLGRIDGCTLPVSRDRDLTRERPVLDRVRYTFGPVLPTERWRAEAAGRYPDLDQRAASARAIIEDIRSLDAGGPAAR